MPYIGLYSFLHTEFQGKTSWKNRCQCPTAGFTHFYEFRVDRAWTAAVCQCPTSGFTHFYEESQTATIETGGVSMPYIGLHPFLRSPFKTNVFPVRSDPEFAYVFESG